MITGVPATYWSASHCLKSATELTKFDASTYNIVSDEECIFICQLDIFAIDIDESIPSNWLHKTLAPCPNVAIFV